MTDDQLERGRRSSSPTRPTPGTPRPYEFPPFERGRLANGLTVMAVRPARPPAGDARRSSSATAPSTSRRRGRRHGPGRPRADRGHGALRRHRPHRGDRATRRLAPRRGRLGRRLGRRRRSRPPVSRPALELLAEVVAPADVPGLGGRAPPRRAAQRPPPGPGRPAPPGRRGVRRRRSTRPTRPITGRPAGPARRSSRWTATARGRLRRAGLDPEPDDPGRRRRPGRRDRRSGDRGGARSGGWASGGRRSPRPAPIRAASALDGRRRPARPRAGRVQTEIRVGHAGLCPADPRLPRGLGHERDPGRPVQLAPEHEAARGEGLHLRRGRRLRPAPRRRAVRGARRREHRGDGRRAGGHARRARPDPRRSG